MKIVGLLTRPDFKSGLKHAKKILTHLESQKIQVLLPPHLANALKRSELAKPLNKMKADFVITLGGDGTTLYAARHLPPDIPLLPVNLESFGFLSECEDHEVEDLLNQVLTGQLTIQETLRLAVWLKNKRFSDAANELSLFPMDLGQPVPVTVQLGKTPKFEFRADGFLVATPLGSTGHALSLGGPILDHHLDAFLLMAAAPLRQGFLPLVVPSLNEISIQLGRPANLFIDGTHITKIPQKTPISVARSKYPLRILRRPSRFYSRLQEKLLRC